MSRNVRQLQRIYDDLCRGTALSETDRAFLMQQARRSLPDDQALLLLDILVLLRDPAAAPLIEGYLQRSEAPRLPQRALWALCRSGLQAKYKDYILR